ncbi:MAG: glycoside hydrolase family 2 [Firmicutes bacterium]|nr:glycoside hydrolase family 2 [Bacillota bacterium]
MKFGVNCSCLDLNGKWGLAYSFNEPEKEYTTIESIKKSGMEEIEAVVPGNFELDLQRAGIIEDLFFGTNSYKNRWLEKCHVWYFREFSSSGFKEEIDAILVFEGLDCYSDIYINGMHVASCDNMLIEHKFHINNYLKGNNEIVVHIRPACIEAKKYDYPVSAISGEYWYESLYVRKAPHMYGWDIMPRIVSAGIWRPVYIEYRPKDRIEEVYLQTIDVSDDKKLAYLSLYYKVKIRNENNNNNNGNNNDKWEIVVNGCCGSSSFEQKKKMHFIAGHMYFYVNDPALWWPKGKGKPNLYNITVSLLRNGKSIDTVSFKYGIRTIELIRTSVTGLKGEGEFCFKVNGERVFIKGSNWVPLDAFHSRDRERIPNAISLVDDIGCNMLRCWGGNVYEDNLFYDLCDEKGIMVWQDFAMACAVYPQDKEFCERIEHEAVCTVKRLRQHTCIVLWCGDNECDMAYYWKKTSRNPNENILTRKILPEIIRLHDPHRPYLPSSPYMDEEAVKTGKTYITEDHLWGPRNYFKSDYYSNSLCHFASEIGYHGCPSPRSIKKFISADKLWPYEDNDEWIIHSSNPEPEKEGPWSYRISLMANQIKEMFGVVPDSLEKFSLLSQICQAEAKKYFIELFRASKWRRTGIIWWNILDGWPQFSDAVVDYYFEKKLAYYYIRNSQKDFCLVIAEPKGWEHDIIACNDTRDNIDIMYSVKDLDTGEILKSGNAVCYKDSSTVIGSIPFSNGFKRFYIVEWESEHESGKNHYISGNPPFNAEMYIKMLEKLINVMGWEYDLKSLTQ